MVSSTWKCIIHLHVYRVSRTLLLLFPHTHIKTKDAAWNQTCMTDTYFGLWRAPTCQLSERMEFKSGHVLFACSPFFVVQWVQMGDRCFLHVQHFFLQYICQPSCIYIKKEVGVSALYFALVFFRSLGRGSWSRKTDQEIWPHDWLHFWNCCGEEVAEQTVRHHGQYWPAFAALSSLTKWFSFAAPKKDKETFHAIMLCDVNPILKLFGLLCKM